MFKVVTLYGLDMADRFDRTSFGLAALCEVENGEILHKFLDKNKMIDSSWRPKRIASKLAIPLLTKHEPKQIQEIVDSSLEFNVHIQQIEFEKAELSNNPHEQMYRTVSRWLESEVDEYQKPQLLSKIPNKWERLDDLIVLQQNAFSSTEWNIFLQNKETDSRRDFWRDIAHSLGGKRLARQHPIAPDKLRSSQTELLYGDSGWVEFLDHGVRFGFDATQVMFSSGNVTERRRIGFIPMNDEVVVDAYAGVGYYSLHMAKRSLAKVVHACELNPNSIKGLKWAIEANHLEESIVIHEGDNNETLPKLYGIADRCHLGLLPSSESVWEHAILCLKTAGGWLHIHMNVDDSKIDAWRDETLVKLRKFAKKHNRNWKIESPHIESVKSYSPRVHHIVLDVHCSEK